MKIVIITGFTATGKSELALELAKKYDGEIISADSVQVYRGLDIGSAKESQDNRKIIKHHLIDIKDFSENYNVGQFLTDCHNAIIDIKSRGKTPIIVGGTGLYIKSLLCGYNLGGANADPEFRNYWEQIAKEKGNDFVWNELKNINPEKANSVHPNNLKRVIRYLEISKNKQSSTSTKIIKTTKEIKTDDPSCDAQILKDCEINNIDQPEKLAVNFVNILSNYEICAVGIIEDREIIYKKIDNRVDKMISTGLKNEVQNLIRNGATRDMQSMNSIGYKEWFDYFNGDQSEKRTIELIKQHSRNYCKRQLTFLKTIPNLKLCKREESKHIIEEFLND